MRTQILNLRMIDGQRMDATAPDCNRVLSLANTVTLDSFEDTDFTTIVYGRLVNLHVPPTFYDVDETNNRLVLSLRNYTTPTTVLQRGIISLASGRLRDGFDAAAALQLSIRTQLTNWGIAGANSVTITYNTLTGVHQFQLLDDPLIRDRVIWLELLTGIDLVPALRSAWPFVGSFHPTVYDIATVWVGPPPSDSFQNITFGLSPGGVPDANVFSRGIVQAHPKYPFYLRCSLLEYQSTTSQRNVTGDILSSLSLPAVDTPFTAGVTLQWNEMFGFRITRSGIDSLKIYFTDTDGYYGNLNGAVWTLTLELRTYRVTSLVQLRTQSAAEAAVTGDVEPIRKAIQDRNTRTSGASILGADGYLQRLGM